MKRFVLVAAVFALAAAAFAAWTLAAPASEAARTAPTVKKPKLPPLPANIRQKRRFTIGVKCDAPPFGYVDFRGRNQGFDVEIARWFSRYAFGNANRVTYECAPTPAREPLLTTNRADLVIATFTYTHDRDTRIDFSRAYYRAVGRLLVRNNGPVRSLRDLGDRTIATTSGSIYDRWMRRCFTSTRPLVTDSFANALIAFRDGRADALMWDDTVLLGIAQTDPNLRLTADQFLALPYGIGIKQGNRALKRWVDARLELMRKRDLFRRILRAQVPASNLAFFSRSILRPKQTFGYSRADSPPENACP